MKLIYKSDYISIKKFDPVRLPDFTVLTGVNGSGKTHLLKAIQNGQIEIESIDKGEVIYYNYNDFTISTKIEDKAPWDAYPLINKINTFKQGLKSIILPQLSPTDALIYNTSQQSYFDFNSLFNNENHYIFLQEKLEKNEPFDHMALDDLMMQERISSDLFHFMIFAFDYIYRAHGNANDIRVEILKSKFEEVQKNTSDVTLSKEDEDMYKYIKNLSSFSVEPPDLLLTNIINEEKNYQFNKINNSLNKIHAEEWGSSTSYLSKERFLEIHGKSPIELINEVLKEYDCNGYFLYATDMNAQFGIAKEHMNVDINLKHNIYGYHTNFENLSSGEKTLMALSLLIHKASKNKIMPRVLLLDEIDSSLHPSMIKRLISVIENLFVKEYGFKVILATHSPSTVALAPEYSIFVVEKEGLNRIHQQNQSEAISLLTEGFATLNKGNGDLSISYNIAKTNLPVLFTEGITDKIIIETAWKKLKGNKEMPFYVQDCFDAAFLRNMLLRTDSFLHTYNKKFIVLFDFDKAGYDSWNQFCEKSNLFESDPHKCLTYKLKEKDCYIMLLPVPSNADVQKQVIKNEKKETYKSESILPIELLFYGEDASIEKKYRKEKSVGGTEIIEFIGVKHKTDFAEKTVPNLPAGAFKNFTPLFDKIKDILSETNS